MAPAALRLFYVDPWLRPQARFWISLSPFLARRGDERPTFQPVSFVLGDGDLLPVKFLFPVNSVVLVLLLPHGQDPVPHFFSLARPFFHLTTV